MLNLNNLSQETGSFNETPIKRGKSADLEPHTAESEQPIFRSLEDIDPRDLFEKFSELVRVTEEEVIDDFELEVERKLDYENIHTIKLDFEPKSSSMKKKPRNGENAERPSLRAINLFHVITHAEESKPSELVELDPNQCMTPVGKERKDMHLSRAACKYIQNE